jgi:hypothetical protein
VKDKTERIMPNSEVAETDLKSEPGSARGA